MKLREITVVAAACCCLGASAGAIETQELRSLCEGSSDQSEMSAPQQIAICTANMRLALTEEPRRFFDADSAAIFSDFLGRHPELMEPGTSTGEAVAAMFKEFEARAAKRSILQSIDWKQALGMGILGAGAALLFSLALLVPRWLWIGMRSDIRRRRERKRA